MWHSKASCCSIVSGILGLVVFWTERRSACLLMRYTIPFQGIRKLVTGSNQKQAHMEKALYEFFGMFSVEALLGHNGRLESVKKLLMLSQNSRQASWSNATCGFLQLQSQMRASKVLK